MPLPYKAQTMVKNGQILLIFFRTVLRVKKSKSPPPKNRPLLGGCFQNFTRAFASLLCMGIPKALNLLSKEINHKTLYQLINKRSIFAERLNQKRGWQSSLGVFSELLITKPE